MKMVATLLYNDFQKHGKNPVYWAILFFPCLIIAVMYASELVFTMEMFEQIASFTGSDLNPYTHFYKKVIGIFGFLLMPYILLLVVYLVEAEHRAGAWKYMLALPLKPEALAGSKLIFAGLSLLLACLFFFLAFWLSLYFLQYYHAELNYTAYEARYALAGGSFLKMYLRSFIALCLLMAVGLRFRNYGLMFILLIVVQALLPTPVNPFRLHMMSEEPHYQNIVGNDLMRLWTLQDLWLLLLFLLLSFILMKFSKYLIQI
jgi:ABC-type transport system involved in multi-copper enzyme maturation permease subunit